MNRLIFLLLALIASLPQAYAVKIVTNPQEDINPVVTFSSDNSGVTVDYVFPGVLKTNDNIFSDSYILSIPGFGLNMTEGEAAWPTHWDTFEIPYGQEANIELLSKTESTHHIKLSPAREPLEDSSNEVYTTDNITPVKHFSGWQPSCSISNDGIQIYRDRNILYVGVYPISYNFEEESINITETLSYRVNFTPSKLRAMTSKESIHEVDDSFMKSVFSSYIPSSNDDNSTLKINSSLQSTQWKNGDSYLILSVPKYTTAINRFANWKRQLGYNVTIINQISWTPSAIKSEIKKVYENNPNLKYLLLFGDEIDLPSVKTFIPNTFYKFYSDFKYGCLDGEEDDLQDLFVGRLSVTSLTEANNVVAKIINYENLSNLSQKGLHCAEFADHNSNDGYEDRRFVRTSEDIANGILKLGYQVERIYYYNNENYTQHQKPLYWNNKNFGYGESLPDFLLNDYFNWKGNAQDVCTSINNGVQYVLHRDHGSFEGWGHPSFSISNINSLTNKSTPIVFSMNCLTGMFQYISKLNDNDTNNFGTPIQTTCFAEAFLRKANAGCVGICAASQTSYSGFNDVLTMEIFQKIWPNSEFRNSFPGYTPDKRILPQSPIRKMGEVLNAAKMSLSKYYKPTAALNKYTTQIFHWLGDPSMKIQCESHPISPMISITIDDNDNMIGTLRTCNINIGIPVQLTKVDNSTSKVYTATGKSFNVSMNEFSKFRFFISGDNIKPTEIIPNNHLQTNEIGEIISVNQENNLLKIHYSIPQEIEKASISIRPITLDATYKTIRCEQENEACIELLNNENGIYVIDLLFNGEILDSKKILIK